jgi:hypothetical protein
MKGNSGRSEGERVWGVKALTPTLSHREREKKSSGLRPPPLKKEDKIPNLPCYFSLFGKEGWGDLEMSERQRDYLNAQIQIKKPHPPEADEGKLDENP